MFNIGTGISEHASYKTNNFSFYYVRALKLVLGSMTLVRPPPLYLCMILKSIVVFFRCLPLSLPLQVGVPVVGAASRRRGAPAVSLRLPLVAAVQAVQMSPIVGHPSGSSAAIVASAADSLDLLVHISHNPLGRFPNLGTFWWKLTFLEHRFLLTLPSKQWPRGVPLLVSRSKNVSIDSICLEFFNIKNGLNHGKPTFNKHKKNCMFTIFFITP